MIIKIIHVGIIPMLYYVDIYIKLVCIAQPWLGYDKQMHIDMTEFELIILLFN